MGEQDVADQRGAFACREGPVTRVVAGPSFAWAPGARAPAFRRRRVPLGCPLDHVSGAGSGPPGSPSDATRRAKRAIAPRHPARWRGASVTRDLAWRRLPLAPPGRLARRGGRGDAGGSSPGREGAFRAARFALRGFGRVILLRLATKHRTRGPPTMPAPLASLQLASMRRSASLRGGSAARRRPFAPSRAAGVSNLA